MFDQFDSIAGEQWANQSLRGGARNKSSTVFFDELIFRTFLKKKESVPPRGIVFFLSINLFRVSYKYKKIRVKSRARCLF